MRKRDTHHFVLEGWTALIWAIHGHQLEAVEVLLKHGANKSIKTKYARTVYQYPTLLSIKELLKEEESSPTDVVSPPPPLPPPPALESPTTPTPNTTSIPHNDRYYQASVDGYNHFLNHHQHTKSKFMSSASNTTKSNANTDNPKPSPPDFSQLLCIATPPKEQQQQRNQKEAASIMTQEEEEDIKRWETSIRSSNTFSWNQCLADQMFVFSQDEMHYILDHALHVTDIKSLANKSPLSNELWQPANVVFLSARFAHYCSSRELLALLLNTAAVKLSRIIKVRFRSQSSNNI